MKNSRKKIIKRKKKSFFYSYKIYYWLSGFIIFLSIIYFFRSSFTLLYFIAREKLENSAIERAYLENHIPKGEQNKIKEILNSYKDKIFGIDISQHQGIIKWDSIGIIDSKIPISYIFVRATRGISYKDPFFSENWENIKNKGILRGAYHYYDVNKNSTLQANNFISSVKLKPGDLPPVLDVEDLPQNQSLDSLKKGLTRWLTLVENHYKIKPIIYSSDAYFLHHIPDLALSEYPVWVANYNPILSPNHPKWTFWQFSKNGIIKGINQNYTDLNLFNGSRKDLLKITLK